MIVCSCNALSDAAIKDCLGPGPDCPFTPAQVYRCLGCSPQCGRCARTIREIMDAALPTVHSACTTRCSRRCPLSEGYTEDSSASARASAADQFDGQDTIEIHDHAA